MKLTPLILTAAAAFIGWNMYQYNQSFDNCEKLLSEVRRNLETLHNEISSLQASMGVSEADYE